MSRDIRFLINRQYVLRKLMGERFDPAAMMKQDSFGTGILLQEPHGGFMADAWETGQIVLSDYGMPHVHHSRFHLPIRSVMLHSFRVEGNQHLHLISHLPSSERRGGSLLWEMAPWHPNRTVSERHYSAPTLIPAKDQKTTYTEVGVFTEYRSLLLVTHAHHDLVRAGGENMPLCEDPLNHLEFSATSTLYRAASKHKGLHPYLPALDFDLFTRLFPKEDYA